jgi:hypothetical protein
MKQCFKKMFQNVSRQAALRIERRRCAPASYFLAFGHSSFGFDSDFGLLGYRICGAAALGRFVFDSSFSEANS